MNRLWVKLALAFLAVSLVAIGVVAAFALRATGDRFRQYIVATGMGAQSAWAAALVNYYATSGSWAGVDEVLAELGPGGMSMGRGRGSPMVAGPNLAVADPDGQVLASRTGEWVGEQLPPEILAQGTPLTLDGQRIGTLLHIRSADAALDPLAEAFLRQVRESLLWAALGAVALSLVLGILFSRLLTAPLARLTHAAQAIAAGDLTQRVEIRSRDETGELGEAFNDMAASLAAAEALRRNLIADISHELRTPLTVVQGNLQALLDGVYPLEMAQVASLYDETRLLTRLVDDLHDLALADAGQLRLARQTVDIVAVARAAIAQFAPVAEAARVQLTLEAEPALPIVSGDADRLAQVLRNLLSNALRHTPAGGQVAVRVSHVDAQVRVQVTDTGTGIAAEDLPHVFDRFYRGSDRGHDRRDRSRQGGTAGLGLAIARQLVTAHGGVLTVESQHGTGTVFTMELPGEATVGSNGLKTKP